VGELDEAAVGNDVGFKVGEHEVGASVGDSDGSKEGEAVQVKGVTSVGNTVGTASDMVVDSKVSSPSNDPSTTAVAILNGVASVG